MFPMRSLCCQPFLKRHIDCNRFNSIYLHLNNPTLSLDKKLSQHI